MNRFLHSTAFFLGLAAIGWVAAGYIGSNPLALLITLLIGVFYLTGALELRRFDAATSTLAQALSDLPQAPPSLGDWLDRLHPSLRNAVRLRIEGERVGLPGPALTPYLTGLLVLLGMLGTFLGMVVTLKGTGAALESAADLLAIRASLAAPVKGLGLAFGTSLAGVAASAMLGLVAALCRRDRLLAAQWLDTRIATTLRAFSSAHRREESFRLLQQQGEAMPALLDRLQAMMAAMQQQSLALHERLAAGQDRFHSQAEAAYAGLAASVGRSLQESLTESARQAGAAIQPVVEATMAGIARETAVLHEAIGHGVERQLDGMTTRLETTTHTVAGLWARALASHQQTSETLAADLRTSLDQFTGTFDERATSLVQGVTATFDQRATSLLGSVGQAHTDLQTQLATNDRQRLAAWTQALEAMAVSLQEEWQQAGAHTAAQHEHLCRTLAQTAADITARSEAHAHGTMTEIVQLMRVASEAPRAAAEVVAELRQKLSDSMVRDNAMLDERGRILGTLETLLGAVNHAATEQRVAIDALVGTSAALLERVGTRFTETLDAEAGKMAGLAAHLGGSAVEVARLGEAFGAAVERFSESNDKLGARLQRIEGALGKSMARSDEQLAYYVAQARDVVDLSLLSQKQIVEDLKRLASERALAVSAA